MPLPRHKILFLVPAIVFLAHGFLAHGREPGAEPVHLRLCEGCHGEAGAGDARTGVPRLAGLPAGYLVRQLEAFASGARSNPLMTPVAELLDSKQREALARHYAALTGPPATAPPPDGSGRELAQRGDPGRGLPPCAACHGVQARARWKDVPPLEGQPASYLTRQLQAWRLGRRGGAAGEPMTEIARRLTGAEIEAVAAFYAGGF
jgi:cytochrome c553